MKKLLTLTTLIIPLTGCSIFDDIGRHMPVIGERCENWQCFTAGGQAQSDAKKRALAARENGSYKRTPINGEQNVQTPAPAPTPAPASGKPLTPFDMTPDQLNSMPDPYSNN